MATAKIIGVRLYPSGKTLEGQEATVEELTEWFPGIRWQDVSNRTVFFVHHVGKRRMVESLPPQEFNFIYEVTETSEDEP
jgi:hypothetical protein